MPDVFAQGKVIACNRGDNLRKILLDNDVNLYNGNASFINCRGIGTCGTCAVMVAGEVSEVTWQDQTRRSLPPHSPTKNLRLACQVKVLGDVRVTKFNGFWGQDEEIVWQAEG